jgi:Fe-S oxidoreductase
MACVATCPAFIEIVDDIVDMRRYLTLTEGSLPGTAAPAMRNMGTSGNPWGYAQEERLKWADGLDVPIAATGEHYDILYWVGCSASYDQRNQRIAKSMVRLLTAAGVRFAVMAEEKCHAESGRRMGDEYMYMMAAEENIGNLSRYSFDRIMCHCPHCFNTLSNEYPQFGGDYEVVHHSVVLRDLIAEGRLERHATSNQRIAFHDSCYLGRYNGIIDAPREVVRAAGADVVDVERRGENGLCCGGGGGRMWFELEQQEQAIEVLRMEEILATHPDVVGVACPFCLTMLESGAATMGVDDVKVRDIAEILAEGLD